VEPPRYGIFRRIAMAISAFFGRTRRAGEAAGESTPVDPLTPTGPTPAGLTALPPLTRAERARQSWHATDYTEQLDALIAGPQLSRCANDRDPLAEGRRRQDDRHVAPWGCS
jgi:hypothetical protein